MKHDIYLEKDGEKVAIVQSYTSKEYDVEKWFLTLHRIYPCDNHSLRELLEYDGGLKFVVIKNDNNLIYDDCYIQAYSELERGHIEKLWVNAYSRKEIPIEAIS